MRPRIADIVTIAAELSLVDRKVILGPSRLRRVIRVRQACMAVAREAGYSFPMIGGRMGRDHSTVIHGVEASSIYAERDRGYLEFLNRLRDAAQRAKPHVADRLTPYVPGVVAPTSVPEPDAEPEPEPEPETVDYNLSDDELLSLAVAKHYAASAGAA